MTLKLRITGGEHKGRLLQSPQNNVTHPMGDKLRLSIFNVLGDISGLTALDLCAGTGAVGLEALSRRASHITFVENNLDAISSIRENIAAIKELSMVTIVQSSAISFTKQKAYKYNLIFMDPPYALADTFNYESLSDLLESSGVIVLSLPNDSPVPDIPRTKSVKSIVYTKASLHFYKGD